MLLLVLPSVLFGARLTSSMATGTVIAALLAILFGLGGPSTSQLARAIRFFPLVALMLTLHIVLAGYFTEVDFGRALSSLALLGIFFAGAGSMADLLANVENSRMELLIHRCFIGLLTLGMAACFGVLQPLRGSFDKPVFPFTEPSHFALVIIPFLIFACVSSSSRKRLLYIGIALTEALLLQNLTFLVGCLFAAAISLRRRHVGVLILVLIPVLLLLDLSYYTDRVNFSGEVQNLSSLVYLQGWQLIEESLTLTHGIGRGFQQLGLSGTDVAAADLIRALTDSELNLLDGGFNLSKLVCEFGALGALLSAWFIFVAFGAFRTLRSVAVGRNIVKPLQLFCASVILGYLLELLLRGAGYFTPTGLLLVTALMLKSRQAGVFTHVAKILSYRRMSQNEVNS
jgi:hypothetical protein